MQVSKFHSTFRYPNECVHIPTFWRQDFEFPVTTLVDFATWLAITIEDGIVEASRSNPGQIEGPHPISVFDHQHDSFVSHFCWSLHQSCNLHMPFTFSISL